MGLVAIGFTGGRAGMTDQQKAVVEHLLSNWPISIEAHHGGCIGADAHFHEICERLGVPVEIHPGYSARTPTDLTYRADLKADVIHEPKTHFARNRDIVEFCTQLIGCPRHMNQSRGGTWYTINYARKIGGKSVTAIDPNGELI